MMIEKSNDADNSICRHIGTAVKAVLTGFIIIALQSCSPSNDKLIANLDHDNPRVRKSSLSTLLLRGHDPDTIQKLSELLSSDNDRLVFLVTQILSTPADKAAIPSLGQLLTHKSGDIRNSVVQSLGLIKDKSGTPFLATALKDSSATVRCTALRMLGFAESPESTDYIRACLDDPSAKVRTEAIQALYVYREAPRANITAKEFTGVMFDSSETVRFVAVQALSYSYPDYETAGKLLVKALDDRSCHVRKKAIEGIALILYTDGITAMKKIHDYVTYDEQIAISLAIKTMTGEDFPAFRAQMAEQDK